MNEVIINTLRCEFSKPCCCFRNVRKKVSKEGGKVIYGWLKGQALFDEKPLIQTWVHHCIWENKHGEHFDITPQISPLGLILFPLTVSFVFDDQAQLRSLPNEHYQSLETKYTPLKNEPQVLKAIEYLNCADLRLTDGDLQGERYWCHQAARLLGGWIEPFGTFGLSVMRPFKLDEE